MPTWKEVNAALQSWFSDAQPPTPKPRPQPKPMPINAVLSDYFKGGKK
jgi:murein endopeptidase